MGRGHFQKVEADSDLAEIKHEKQMNREQRTKRKRKRKFKKFY
jgi:hypothetical protein